MNNPLAGVFVRPTQTTRTAPSLRKTTPQSQLKFGQWRTNVPKAYWITNYRSIANPAGVVAYAELAGPAIRAAGGRILARSTPAKTYEQGINERVVIIEFDSVAAAIAAYESEPYKAALRTLGNSADRDLRIVEAVA
jgi:uncharacterized protein (DUF1330 family)